MTEPDPQHNLKALAETSENFCRVFEVPETFPSSFGRAPVTFQQVDWFHPLPRESMREEYPELEALTWEIFRAALMEFVQEKVYVRPGRRYLILTEFGEAFVFRGADVEKKDA